MSATVLPAAIPAELTALLAKQPLAKLVSLMSEIGGCDQSPTGRALEGALSHAIDTKVDEETTEDAVYELLSQARAIQAGVPEPVYLTDEEYSFASSFTYYVAQQGYASVADSLPDCAAGLKLLAEYVAEPIAKSPDDGGAFFRKQTRLLQKATVAKINLAVKEGRTLAKNSL